MNPQRLVSAALVVLFCSVFAGRVTAQDCTCMEDATITKVGTTCGVPPVTLNATPPILGEFMVIFLTSPLPNAIAYMGSSSPPGAPFILGGCPVYLNLADLMVFGPFVTNAVGALSIDLFNELNPALCGLTCNIQFAVDDPPGPVEGTAPGFRISNAIQAVMGCDGGGSRNGFPGDAFCSYTQGGYAGSGTPGQIFDANFVSTFPGGLEAGDYTPGNGNTAPNGLLWEGNATGRAALKTFLPGGGPSGAITSDQLNPTTTFGGGALAHQAAALGLNTGFNTAGVLMGLAPGFANLIYVNLGDSLSAYSVSQILGVINDVLAGGALPAGYTFASLATLATNLNESFDNCQMSTWASSHLFAP